MRCFVVWLFALALGTVACASPPRPPVKSLVIDYTVRGQRKFRAGDLARAYDLFSKALGESARTDYRRGRLAALANMGLVELHFGRNDAAERNLLAAVRIAREIEDLSAQVVVLSSLSRLYLRMNRLPAAEISINEAVAAHERSGAEQPNAALFNLRGALARWRGELDEALKLHRQALAVAVEAKARRAEATSRYHLGLSLAEQGRFAAAMLALEQALALDKESEHALAITADLHALGATAMKAGEREQGRSYLVRAMESARRNGDLAQLRQTQQLLEAEGMLDASGLHLR